MGLVEGGQARLNEVTEVSGDRHGVDIFFQTDGIMSPQVPLGNGWKVNLGYDAMLNLWLNLGYALGIEIVVRLKIVDGWLMPNLGAKVYLLWQVGIRR